MKRSIAIIVFTFHGLCAGDEKSVLPQEGLILDLDAAKGLVIEDGNRVAAWRNQAKAAPDLVFEKQDKGRKEPGSGRPSVLENAIAENGKPSLIFHQQELVCADEDFFDALSTGKGHTWIAVIAVHEQRVGVKDVNSFFGNLRNGKFYEGIWGCLDDDNTVWLGARNGKSFGRFDANNPKVSGPVLEQKKFHVIAGRMEAGTGDVKISLHINSAETHAEATFPVNPEANPSRMTIGQERDAVEHPGHESFDGEIARFLIWERSLQKDELEVVMQKLAKDYTDDSAKHNDTK